MSDVDVIVIGGGHNGLVAAAHCARKGKSVLLLEQAETLGGMAASGALGNRAAPRMAHLVHNLSPLMRSSLGMDSYKWPVKMTELDSIALSPEGKHVVVSGRDVRFADGTEHPDADAWRHLTKRLIRYADLLRQLAEAPPPGGGAPWTSRAGLKQMMQLARFGFGVKRLGKEEMREFLRVLLSNAADLILDELPDGPLAGMLAADGLRGATAGPRAPGTVFSTIYRMGHGGRAFLPVGGIGAVVDMLADAAAQAGCQIETGARVTKLLSHEDQITGVVLEDGRNITAKLVLSNIAPLGTARLAGLEHFDIEATRRMRQTRANGSAVKINLRLSDMPVFTGLTTAQAGARLVYAPGVNALEAAFTPAKYGETSDDPVFEAVIPTVQYPSTAPPGKHIMSIIAQYAPYTLKGGWDDASKARLLETVFASLTRFSPDLTSLIEASEVLSPPDIEALTGAPGGHWHHAEMSLDQLLSLRGGNGMGHYRMGPRGLYLCGASAHPGGDLMGLAGLNAARQALSDEARS